MKLLFDFQSLDILIPENLVSPSHVSEASSFSCICACFCGVGRNTAVNSSDGHRCIRRRWCQGRDVACESECQVSIPTMTRDTATSRARNAIGRCPGRVWSWMRERASAIVASIGARRAAMAENRERERRLREEQRTRAEQRRARKSRITRMKTARDELYGASR